MRHVFIINPAAGKRREQKVLDKRIADIKTVMEQRREPYHIEMTQRAGHAEELAREYCETYLEPLQIYVCGGDGTLNEVVNGAAGHDHAAVTVIPYGSGNDFIKIFGSNVPRFQDLKQLVNGSSCYLDLIDCNGRLGINVGSVGLDARVGLDVSRYKRLPLVTGNGAYILSTVVNTLKGVHKPYHIEIDGHEMDDQFTMMAICNGRWYGGTFNPVPDAMPNDGLLDFVVVKKVSRLQVLSMVQHYAKGEGKQYPEFINIMQGRSLTVRCEELTAAQIDGEAIVDTEFTFRLSEKKIRFFYPKGAGFLPSLAIKADVAAFE
jgi:YegS/Rv2252/BmrU family lipid kinase